MSFILESDMQSGKNNNEVNNDGIAIIGQSGTSAEQISLVPGSDLRGPEVKLRQRGHIAPASNPGRPVTQDFSSSNVFVASQAHLGTNAGREEVAAGRGGVHSDASRSGDKELSFGYDCANPATFTQKPSPIDSGSHHNENDFEYHSHQLLNAPDRAGPPLTSGAQRGAEIQAQLRLMAAQPVARAKAKAKTKETWAHVLNLSSMMIAVSVVLTNFGTEQHMLVYAMLSFEHSRVHLQTLF